jgi:hypothetical protein
MAERSVIDDSPQLSLRDTEILRDGFGCAEVLANQERLAYESASESNVNSDCAYHGKAVDE